MKDKLLQAFPNCITSNCFVTEQSETFKVYDREDDCCFVCKENEPPTLSYFTVKNPTGKDVHFLAIDRCLGFGDDDKKCDCAMFDDSVFNFIEIKTACKSKRGKRRRDAFEQLKNTIGIFIEKIDFDSHTLFAHICIGHNGTFPRTSSNQMARRMELFNLYGVELVEGNVIEFN